MNADYMRAYRLKNLDKLRARERERMKRRWAARAAVRPVRLERPLQAVQAVGVVPIVPTVQDVQAPETARVEQRCQACRGRGASLAKMNGLDVYLCPGCWGDRDR